MMLTLPQLMLIADADAPADANISPMWQLSSLITLLIR